MQLIRKYIGRIFNAKVRKSLASLCSTVEGIFTLADTDSEWNWIQGKWDSRFGILIR